MSDVTLRPVIYVFVNKELHMSAGKLSAQAIHAAVLATICASKEQRTSWLEAPHRYIITLEARNESHLRNIQSYLSVRDIKTYEVVDEGANEIEPHTVTAVATTILDKDDEKVQLAMSTFKLYRDDIKVTLEFPR